MAKDEWMRAAMSDDTLVVELLVRLKQSQAASPLKSHPPPPTAAMLPLTWSVRLPRSRALRCDSAAAPLVSQRTTKQQSQRGGGGDSSTRCSPTTPLSWSGAASPSATADGGFEESSRSPSHVRSKGTASNYELASTTTTSRRTRRKKTFAELKEEENSLLKEKVFLKKELTKLRATFKEQSAANESLKRIKVDLGLHSAIYENTDGSKRPTPSQPHQRTASTFDGLCSTSPAQAVHHHANPQADSCGESKAANENQGGFLLPDLNSLPCEEDYCSETLYGMS